LEPLSKETQISAARRGKRRARGVESILRRTYFLMLFLVFAVFMIYSVMSEAARIQANAIRAMTINVANSAAFVDDEAGRLKSVAQNVAYSNLVKERFVAYLISSSEGAIWADKALSYRHAEDGRILTDLLTALIGPSMPVSQIYLYSLESGTFGVGVDNTFSDESVKDQPWYADFAARPAGRAVYCVTDYRLSKYFTGRREMPFLSYCTLYYNKFNTPIGIIEVKKPISALRNKITELGNLYGETVAVYDAAGNQVYPASPLAEDLYERISGLSNEPAMDGVSRVPVPGGQLFYTLAPETGFTAIISIGNRQLWAPIYAHTRSSLLIFLVAAGLTFALSAAMARTITRPIRKIHHRIDALPESLDAPRAYPEIDTFILEFDALYAALVEKHKQTLTFMEREVTLRNQETQSRMLALQSQMNPHFLYNSLAAIQSMAEEGMFEQIIYMCQTISRLLRYISSDQEPLVSFENDLGHMIAYLNCMKIRYEDDLAYEVHAPDDMMALRVPKLCLQLIVENSVKFTTKNVKAPWRIAVRGQLRENAWTVSIQDNGPGFTRAEIDELMGKVAVIDRTGLLPGLELRGMGLLNIYIRLRLIYKERAVFRVENGEGGGAIVTIGGAGDV